MDNAKFERIRDFVNGWGYKPDEVNAYIGKVAPNLEFNAKKASHDKMNALLNGMLGREQKPKATPIPAAAAHETGLAKDLWIMLGTGPDALTMEDLADYYAEYTAWLAAKREAEAPSSMSFSRTLHAMNQEERQRNAAECADIFERHKRIKEAGKDFSMDAFLRGLNTQTDSTPRTLTEPPKQPDGESMNFVLRNLL